MLRSEARGGDDAQENVALTIPRYVVDVGKLSHVGGGLEKAPYLVQWDRTDRTRFQGRTRILDDPTGLGERDADAIAGVDSGPKGREVRLWALKLAVWEVS